MKISWFTQEKGAEHESHAFDTAETCVPNVGDKFYIRDYTCPMGLSPKKYIVSSVEHEMSKSEMSLESIREGISTYPEMQFTEKDDDNHRIDVTFQAMDKCVKNTIGGQIYRYPGLSGGTPAGVISHWVNVILKAVED